MPDIKKRNFIRHKLNNPERDENLIQQQQQKQQKRKTVPWKTSPTGVPLLSVESWKGIDVELIYIRTR